MLAGASAMANQDDERERMKKRTQDFAAALVKAAKEPDSAEFLAEEEERDRKQAAVIAAYHAVRNRPDEPPGQALADVAALAAYLAGKGLAVTARSDGLRI